MNVLFLTTHLNPGGITSYLFLLAEGLKKEGVGLFVASSGGTSEENFRRLGVELVTLPIRTKSELDPRIYAVLPKLARLIKEKNIDVIHANTRITQVMGHLLKKSSGKKYISTCHGYFKTRLSRRIFPCWGDQVIAISPQVAQHLEEDFRVPKDRIETILHGIDVEKFHALDHSQKIQHRKEFGLSDEPVIGIIARLSFVKGHPLLIRAMRIVADKIPNVKLMIVGKGRLEEDLKMLVKNFQLEDNVLFLPIEDRTAEILPLFDVFAMPSLQEGLGLSVMEAQACGLPVVASRVGGLPSLIKDGQTGILFDPTTVEQLPAALVTLLKEKALAAQIGEQAREFIRTNFSSEKMIRSTIGVYSRVTVR